MCVLKLSQKFEKKNSKINSRYYEFMLKEQDLAEKAEQQKIAERKAKTQQETRDREAQRKFCADRDAEKDKKRRADEEEACRQNVKV